MMKPNHTRLIHPDFPTVGDLRGHFSQRLPSNWFYKPVAVEVEITQACNLRCMGCSIIEDVEAGYDGFSVEKIISFLKECSQTSVYCYGLTGGEPLMFLGRVCRIIEESPIDILKIHTNGKSFSTITRAKDILEKLRDSGFGVKNQYIKPTLNVSVGLQTEAGVPLKNIAILTKAFLDAFPYQAHLVLNVTPYHPDDVENLLNELEEEYFQLTGQPFPYHLLSGEHFALQYTHRLSQKSAIPVKWISISEALKNLEGWQHCHNSSQRNLPTPMPRMLLRANGDLYSCCSFGFTGLTGNIHQSSLWELLSLMNQNKKFSLVLNHGISGLYETVRAENPGIENIRVPENYNICKICKVLREPQKLDPVREPIRVVAASSCEQTATSA